MPPRLFVGFRKSFPAPLAPGDPPKPPDSAGHRFPVASFPVFAYLEGMEVRFSPEVETRLQQVALTNGKDAEQLVKDTVTRMLENQGRFIAGVQKGIEQADRGEFVEHRDVISRIDRLFQ